MIELPITIAEVSDCAYQCYRAGAGAIHAHVRDQAGKHILDIGLYEECIAEIKRKAPHIMIQITSEAVGHGGKIRVGFENNFINQDGSIATDNQTRVAEMKKSSLKIKSVLIDFIFRCCFMCCVVMSCVAVSVSPVKTARAK